jgi:predicted TIM-barrel fold metal-dependent hydrolase
MLKPFCSCSISRRSFLGGVAGLGASTILPSQAAEPAVVGKKDRIDTHHHFFSPGIKAAMSSKNLIQGPAISWTLQKTLDDMEAAGTATAILSATTPQVSFLSPNEANNIARENNEYAAKLRGDYKGRFGSFAMLPMHDMDAALKELTYALDVLKADGIGLLTSYGDKWLGHPKFAPVMDEINRRGAILYTHPTSADCCNNLIPNTPPTVVEYGTDTTRTIVDVVFSGTAARCPNIKFIFSHAGGSLPFLTERLQKMPVIDKSLQEKVPNGVMHELQRFYYDTAWAANPYTLSSLLQLVSKDQVLYGSDYPYRTSEDNVKGLLKYGFNEKDMTQITRGNAIKLMPRLA